jgi:hypothetical protein
VYLYSKLGVVLFNISLNFDLPYFRLQRHPGWTNLLYLSTSDLYNLDFRPGFILRTGNFCFIEYICYLQPDSKVVESDV